MTLRDLIISIIVFALAAAYITAVIAYSEPQQATEQSVDRSSVLLRTCDDMGTIRTDEPVCAAFASEIKRAADTAETIVAEVK